LSKKKPELLKASNCRDSWNIIKYRSGGGSRERGGWSRGGWKPLDRVWNSRLELEPLEPRWSL